MKACILAVVVLAVSIVSTDSFCEELAGRWVVTSLKTSVQKIDHLEGTELLIEGDTFTMGGDKVVKGTFKTNPKATPSQIIFEIPAADATERPTNWQGIYQIKDGMLTLCIGIHRFKGLKSGTSFLGTPSAFDPQEGELRVYKRIGAVAVLKERTWKSSDGQYSISATLIKVDGDNVHLKKTDGKTIVVPISKLSSSDVEYIKSQQ